MEETKEYFVTYYEPRIPDGKDDGQPRDYSNFFEPVCRAALGEFTPEGKSLFLEKSGLPEHVFPDFQLEKFSFFVLTCEDDISNVELQRKHKQLLDNYKSPFTVPGPYVRVLSLCQLIAKWIIEAQKKQVASEQASEAGMSASSIFFASQTQTKKGAKRTNTLDEVKIFEEIKAYIDMYVGKLRDALKEFLAECRNQFQPIFSLLEQKAIGTADNPLVAVVPNNVGKVIENAVYQGTKKANVESRYQLDETEAEKWDAISNAKYGGKGWAAFAKISLKEKGLAESSKDWKKIVKKEAHRIESLVKKHRAKQSLPST